VCLPELIVQEPLVALHRSKKAPCLRQKMHLVPLFHPADAPALFQDPRFVLTGPSKRLL
jgi:hypothetical protein